MEYRAVLTGKSLRPIIMQGVRRDGDEPGWSPVFFFLSGLPSYILGDGACMLKAERHLRFVYFSPWHWIAESP
jgi:hypothetical protein